MPRPRSDRRSPAPARVIRAARARVACAVVVSGFVLAACHEPEPVRAPTSGAPGEPPKQVSSAPAAPEVRSFTAIVRVVEEDRQSGRKGFRGVMLERDDGTRVVVSYGVDALWRSFADARVVVETTPWAAPGQALVAPHARVGKFRHADKRRDGRPVDYSEVSEERTLRGHYADAKGEPGTKSEGEPYVTFVEEGGTTWRVRNEPPDAPRGVIVTVRARVVDDIQIVSVAAIGGPHLFIVRPEAR